MRGPCSEPAKDLLGPPAKRSKPSTNRKPASIRGLHTKARDLLTRLRYFAVKLKLEDGTMGWSEEAPFERIIVTAGGPEVPEPLIEQLDDPGRLLIPVGGQRRSQELIMAIKERGRVRQERKGGVVTTKSS